MCLASLSNYSYCHLTTLLFYSLQTFYREPFKYETIPESFTLASEHEPTHAYLMIFAKHFFYRVIAGNCCYFFRCVIGVLVLNNDMVLFFLFPESGSIFRKNHRDVLYRFLHNCFNFFKRCKFLFTKAEMCIFILNFPIDPFTTEPQATFLLLENDNLGIIN